MKKVYEDIKKELSQHGEISLLCGVEYGVLNIFYPKPATEYSGVLEIKADDVFESFDCFIQSLVGALPNCEYQLYSLKYEKPILEMFATGEDPLFLSIKKKPSLKLVN